MIAEIGLLVGVLAFGAFFYFKGSRDEKRAKKAEQADILRKHSKIDAKKVKRDEVYEERNWK